MTADEKKQTSEQANPTHMIWKLVLGVAIIAFVGVAGYMLLQKKPTSLALDTFYPEETTFYAQVETNERFIKRMVALADSQQNTGTLKSLKSVEEKEAEKKVGETRLQKAIQDKYATIFKPAISIGVWMPSEEATLTRKTGESLVVLPLNKENASRDLESLMSEFDLDADSFQQVTLNNVNYMIDDESQAAYAIQEESLLITNSADAMIAVIGHISQKDQPSFLDTPVNEKYLGILPKSKDGFFIFNNAAVLGQVKSARGKGQPDAKTMAHIDQFVDVIPVSVGAIHIASDTLVNVDSFTPVIMENLNNQPLRGALRLIYASSETMDQASLLPEKTTMAMSLSGIDHLYDFVVNHVLPPAERKKLDGLQGVTKIMNLDLRDDLVAFFGGQLTFAITEGQKPPMILLSNNEQKNKTFESLIEILGSGMLPVEKTESTVKDVTVHNFAVPMQQTSVSMAATKNTVFLAGSEELDSLMAVKNGKQGSLASAPLFKSVNKDMPKELTFKMFVNIKEQARQIEERLKTTPLNGKVDKDVMLQVSGQDWADAIAVGVWSKKVSEAEDMIMSKMAIHLSDPKPVSSN